jgi:hypothetical protein
MQTFEYVTSVVECAAILRKAQTKDTLITQHLNEMGSQGWELVSVALCPPDTHRLYFKRPIP